MAEGADPTREETFVFRFGSTCRLPEAKQKGGGKRPLSLSRFGRFEDLLEDVVSSGIIEALQERCSAMTEPPCWAFAICFALLLTCLWSLRLQEKDIAKCYSL